jgi:signal transduction histidine kinase
LATDHLRIVANALAQSATTGTVIRRATLERIARDSSVARVALSGPAADAAGTPLAAVGADAESAIALLARNVPRTDSTHEGWEIWSADGARRLVTGSTAGHGGELSLRGTMRAVARTDSVVYSPLYTEQNRVYSYLVAPVHAGGHIVGYLAERRRIGNAAQVEKTIRDLTGETGVLVYVVSQGSGLWTTLRGAPVRPPIDLEPVPATFEASGAGGRLLFGARGDIGGSPLSLVLMRPEAEVLRQPFAFLRRMLGIGAVLLLCGLVGAVLLSRHVTRPLRTVTTAAEAVAAGDYRKRVPVTRRDELGRLGETFNTMAERIGASHDELADRVEQSAALAAELEFRNEELRAAQDETLRAVRRTERLQQVTAALAGAVDFEGVASVIVREGLAAADAAAGSIFLFTGDHQALELVRSQGHGAEPLLGWTIVPLAAPIPVAAAVRSQEPVYVASPAEWRSMPGGVPQPPIGCAWAGFPLVARGRTIGAMGLSFATEQPFDRETRALLLALSQQCAQALDRAMLFDSAVQARHAAEEARRAAQSANAAKSSFLAMMSHELRTPLNAIGGYAQLMEMELRGPVTGEQRDDLERIQRNQQHLLSIINDILNLSRIEAGQLTITAADVPLVEVLAEVEAMIAPQAAARGLRYEASAGADLVVHADREKLRQVLLNLVSNAVRFTEGAGSVRVSGEAAGNQVIVRVTDSGIGIPADKLQAIFEPFVQVDSGLTRRTGGTGLGLAISRDLMQAMGGRIDVSSELGRGSTFTISLPRAAGVAAA